MRQRITISGERARPDESGVLTFEFYDAGHVLGSSGILLKGKTQTVFYTGDVNFDDQSIMQSAVFPEEGVDVLIIECTRGDHETPADWSRESEEQRLAQAITDAFGHGGCVLIPVFALGKTQELLAMIHKFRRANLLPECPVYIGGLSAKMTEIYDARSAMSRRQLPRLQLLPEVNPFVLNGQTIRDAPARPGRIYALSSGMMTPNTLSNIFARRVIEDPRHSVLFVGYADPLSPAGILRAAKPGQEIALGSDEPPQRVHCNIKEFQFSAHASRESLINYARKLAPKKVILIHGDPPAVDWMRAKLLIELPGAEVIVPTPGMEIEV
jgi:Cft2 family RNA processing exonuclease